MEPHRSAPRRAGPVPSTLIGALLVVAGLMLALRAREDGVTREGPAFEGEVTAPRAAPAPGWAGLPDPLTVAALLDDVSADPPVRTFLHERDWIGRAVRAAAALAAGRVPRELVRGAAPAGRFSVETVGRETVISVESYRRYDALADAVGGISPAAVRALITALRAPIEAAYRSAGDPSAPLDALVARALLRVEAAPVPEGEILVRPAGAYFVLEDPHLEALGDVEKQLLRMGPRNARVLQAKAREIREALGLDAPAPAPTALAR